MSPPSATPRNVSSGSVIALPAAALLAILSPPEQSAEQAPHERARYLVRHLALERFSDLPDHGLADGRIGAPLALQPGLLPRLFHSCPCLDFGALGGRLLLGCLGFRRGSRRCLFLAPRLHYPPGPPALDPP